MRCRNCDYPLWNLRARKCPECGASFRPCEFEFVPNSVRFCCPHCDQPYYGVAAQGHLAPRQFDCVSCGNAIDMDEMVLRPAEGVQEQYTTVDLLPWLRRASTGWFRCWWQTCWLGMIAPVRLARGTPPESPTGSAWWYAAVTLFLCALGGATLPLVVLAIISAATGSNSDAGEALLIGAIFPFGHVAANLLIIVFWGLVAHAALRLTGGCTRGIGHTFQAVCYSAGPNLLMAVPCLGFYCFSYVSFTWWIVSAILMLAAMQGVHGGRATLAVLIFPVLMILAIVGLYMGLFYYAMSMAANIARQPALIMPAEETQLMVDAVIDWAADHDGELPAFALELVRGDVVTEDDFVALDSNTVLEDIPLADGTADDFTWADESDRDAMLDAAIDSQPDGIIAHRVGDFVFTYHGIDPSVADRRLWLVLMISDPDIVNTLRGDSMVYVGDAVGGVTQFRASELLTRIAEQNEVRAAAGLPPLPEDLADITHDEPVVE